MRSLFALAFLAAVTAWVLRRRPKAIDITDDIEDWATDVYLIELTTPSGLVNVESRFPFVGSLWGEYFPTEDDGDD